MRLLVVGAGGQLGRELVALAASRGVEVTAAGHGNVDITNAVSVRKALEMNGPDAVINCAAWTRVDAAESEVDAAYRVNAFGARVLATACQRFGAPLVHLSTDFVFDGTATAPIDEWSRPSPLGAYGASKLAGEDEVRSLCPDHLIVRTAWLYGQAGPNFVLTMLKLGRERGALRVVADQHGSPTWTGHLAPALLRLLELEARGTFHITNSGETTWHGFATEIISTAGMTHVPVEPIETRDYPAPARRPRFSVLDNSCWRALGEAPLPHWRDGLRAYVASLSGAQVTT